MKVGSMFAGIGGFDLGFERAGFEVAWCIEWDKNAQKVLRHRFPNAIVYGDIREVDPAQLAPVDVVCGGFPCQDLSVAGKRKGLAGERSGLFHDAMRLVRHLNPSLLVLENVPGLLSSNRGLDFATVLREVGEGWHCQEVAWRVLDSRYFGVAQRRRRVFVAASAAIGCAEQVLALAEGVRWHPAARDEAREDASADAPRGVDGGGIVGTSCRDDWKGHSANQSVNDAKLVLQPVCFPFRQVGGIGAGQVDASPALTCLHEAPIVVGAIDCDIPKQRAQNAAQGHYLAIPIHDKATRHMGQSGNGSGNGLGIGADGDPAPTLTIGDKHAVAVNISNGEPRVSDVVGTLDAARESRGSSQQRFVMQSAFRKSKRAQTVDDDETWVDDGLANTLNGFDTGDTRTTHAVAFGISNQPTPKIGTDICPSLDAKAGGGGRVEAVAFTQNQREEVRNLGDLAGALSGQGTHQTNYVAHTIDMQAGKGNANVGDGMVSPTLCKPSGNDVHAVAFTCKDYGADASEVAPTLRAMPHDGSHANGGGQLAVAVLGDHTHTLTHEGHDASEDGTGRGTPVVAFNWQNGGGYGNANEGLGITHDGTGPLQRCQTPAVAFTCSEQSNGFAWERPIFPTITAQVPSDTSNLQTGIRAGMVVRRLTPTECERLQGFPDGWTQIGTAEKPTADSHRYKQLGNAVTVNVAEWIARRAMKALKGDA